MHSPIKIVFLILPEIHLLDMAGPVQVFQEAADYGANVVIDYCSFMDGLQTSGAMPFGVLKSFQNIKLRSGDYLIIPGASISSIIERGSFYPQPLVHWVQQAYNSGVQLVSICTGAFFLASLGMLNGKKCTTHWKRTAQLKSLFPNVQLTENVLYTEDQGIYTSAGVTAGIDLALHIVKKIGGENIAFKVAHELVVYLRRAGNETQQSVYLQHRNHIHYNIHKVQDYMQDHLDKGASLPVLSDVACMSTRNLTRTFKKETGITINAYLNLVRIEKLKELARNTDFTRRKMAQYCGLKSERQVIRLLKQVS